MAESKEKSKGWYPGKFLAGMTPKRGGKRKDSVTTTATSLSLESNSTGANSSLGHEEDSDDEIESSRDVDIDTSPVIGDMTIVISRVKFLRIKEASAVLEVEGSSFTIFENRESEQQSSKAKIDAQSILFNKKIGIKHLNSDIVITVGGKSALLDNQPAVIIIPITSFLTFSGAVSPPKEQWYQLFPVYSSISKSLKNRTKKFISGFPDYPGYALTKPKEPIGFISLSASLSLKNSALKLYITPAANVKVGRGFLSFDCHDDCHQYFISITHSKDVLRHTSLRISPLPLNQMILWHLRCSIKI
jgi:hypothetical protein